MGDPFAKLPTAVQKLAWLLAIWLASVAALAAVAVLLHGFMALLGMRTV
jgi:hypothetical protein